MGETYFHCAPIILRAGSIIEPGNWGRIVGAYGYIHPQFLREIALETARRQIAPDAPSRLNCLFMFKTIEAGRSFKFREHQNGFATSHIYEVEPVNDNANLIAVPMDALHNWSEQEAAGKASLYWSNRKAAAAIGAVAPAENVGISPDFHEILSDSAVRVLRLVE